MTRPEYTEEAIARSAPPSEYGRAPPPTPQPSQATGTFEETLTPEMRVALRDFEEVTTVCNWCADQCLGHSELEPCARLCRDVADLAALNVAFLARDSAFGVDVAETFAYAAEECAELCAQHPDSHCQVCAAVLRRAIDSTWTMLHSFEQGPSQEQHPTERY